MPYNRVLNAILSFLRDVSEPFLRPFRRIIPMVGRSASVRSSHSSCSRSAETSSADAVSGSERGCEGLGARARRGLAAVAAADQISKAWVKPSTSIAQGELRNVFLGIDFVNVRNRGVAFGLLSGAAALVLAAHGGALRALLVYFATHPARPLLWLPTGLLVGGALGNLTDRVRGESVTDFIDLPLWPPFNLADTAITLGVVCAVGAGEEKVAAAPAEGGR